MIYPNLGEAESVLNTALEAGSTRRMKQTSLLGGFLRRSITPVIISKRSIVPVLMSVERSIATSPNEC
jgi:hypothetical protein